MHGKIKAEISQFLAAFRDCIRKNLFNRQEVLLLVFGEGGHSMAMRRVMYLLKLDDIPIVQLRESGSSKILNCADYTVQRIMPKRSGKLRLILVPLRVALNLGTVLRIFLRYRVRFILTTGPIIAAIPCLIGRLIGVPSVFIESWARFSSVSRAGKVLMALGTLVYYQNWELTPLIPKGRYCGRL